MPWLERYSTMQITFLAAMVSADFAIGLVLKNILAPTLILEVIRIDMILPVAMMLLTRKILDQFGTLLIYELLWGLFALFAMPTAFGLPGLLKLLPALLNGLILDTLMRLIQKSTIRRFFLTAIAGSLLTSISLWAIKLAMGMPWERFTQLLFSLELLSGIIVWSTGALLALMMWQRLANHEAVLRLQLRHDD